MKNILPVLLLCYLFTNCKSDVLGNAALVSKYIVFDEIISPQLNICEDTLVQFKESKNNCMFKLQNMSFEVEYKISLDKGGHMHKFELHSVNNGIDYQKFGIEKDTMNPRKLNGYDFWIRLSKDQNKVIDGTDTLEIEKVFPEEKLIFVEKSKEKKGRRFIYEYK